MQQPDTLHDLKLPRFPGQEIDPHENHFQAFCDQMQFQLDNNAHKGDWLEYVQQPPALERLISEIEAHTEKLTLTLRLYQHLQNKHSLSPLAQRYCFQLITEYAADTANCAMFAFLGMLARDEIQDVLKKTPVLPEEFTNPLHQAAQQEVFKAMGIQNPYHNTPSNPGEMQGILREAAIMAGISTKNTSRSNP